MMRKLAVIVLVSLSVAVTGSTAGAADADAAAASACRQAAEAKIRKNHKKAERISFAADKTKVKQESKKEISVKGAGEFEKKGKTRKFSFRCTYDAKKQQVSDVSIEAK